MRKGLSTEERELLSSPQEVGGMIGETGSTMSAASESGEIENLTPELSELHRTFAQSLASTLTDCLSRNMEVSLRHDGVSTYSQFVFGQPVPCCCAIVASETAKFEFFVSISPTILFPMLDRLVGAGESDPIPQRPITEIERGLIEVLLAQVIAVYEDAWRPVLALNLNLSRLEHNIQQSHLLSGSEATYRTRYDVRLDAFSGFIEFCLPWEASKQLRQRLKHGD